MSAPKGVNTKKWGKKVSKSVEELENSLGKASKAAKVLEHLPYIFIAGEAVFGVVNNLIEGAPSEEYVDVFADATVDVGIELAEGVTTFIITKAITAIIGSAARGAIAGSVALGAGTVIGAVVGLVVGVVSYVGMEVIPVDGERTLSDIAKDRLGEKINRWFN